MNRTSIAIAATVLTHGTIACAFAVRSGYPFRKPMGTLVLGADQWSDSNSSERTSRH